jgi:hypothetical protein
VPGGVDQVDPVVVPFTADRCGEDGDATVALLGVEVGDGRPVVDLTAFVGGSRRIEDPFGEGGLTRVDVGEDAEVADGGQRSHELVAHSTWPFQGDPNRSARCTGPERHAGVSQRAMAVSSPVPEPGAQPAPERGEIRITSNRERRTAS